MDLLTLLIDNLVAILAVLTGFAGTCIAVIGTLAGVGIGGIIGYETQKRLQERQRELDLNKQKREMQRDQLLELSSKFNTIATLIYTEGLITNRTEDEINEDIRTVAKVGTELGAAIEDENLMILLGEYLDTSDTEERVNIHKQIQILIRDEIDKTFDPKF